MADPQLLGDVLAAEALLLTPEGAAKVLRVGRTTIYALMKADEWGSPKPRRRQL
jgi:excisionase family DNA binding protein